MSGNQEIITKEQYIPILAECLYDFGVFVKKNPDYSINTARKTLHDKVYYIENERYVCLRHNKQKKFLIKDEKGTIRNYIWDKKDKIYKTKKNDRIVLPNISCCMEDEGADDYYREHGAFGDGDKYFHNSVIRNRAENHTGNHHRNSFVKVPPRAIGR
jgi:hypothetical protein